MGAGGEAESCAWRRGSWFSWDLLYDPAWLHPPFPAGALVPLRLPRSWAHPSCWQPHGRLGITSDRLLQGHRWARQGGQQPVLAGTSLGSPLPAKA